MEKNSFLLQKIKALLFLLYATILSFLPKRFLITLGIGVLILILLWVFLAQLNKAMQNTSPTSTESPIVQTLPLGGSLYLSALMQTEQTGTLKAFSINVADEGLSVSTDTIASVPSFSRVKNYLTFLGANSSTSTSLTVYKAQLTDKNDSLETQLQQALPSVTPTELDYYRMLPVISPAGAILYASLTKEQYDNALHPDGVLAETWTIRLVDHNNRVYEVVNGIQPKWLDEKHFAFLRNDGVYLYDFTTQQSKLFWKVDFSISHKTGFDVSEDGEFVVLSDTEGSSLFILGTNSWTQETLSFFISLPITALSPVFSPDDAYIAMLTQSPRAIQTTQTTLQYYSLAEKSFVDKFTPFDQTTFNSLYLTDWK